MNDASRWGFDPRRLLASATVYNRFEWFLRGRHMQTFVREYVRARPGNRILDVGCGPGNVLAELPDPVDYVGFDMSVPYIEAARRQFGTRGRFVCRTLEQAAVDELGPGSFDVVVAHGVLHHLDDGAASELFRLARAALRPGGRLVTGDGCWAPGQSWPAYALVAMDRGGHVRTEAAYVALAQQSFAHVASEVRHDTFRVPYTMLFLECRA